MDKITYSVNEYDSNGYCIERGITIWINQGTGIKFKNFNEFAEFVDILDFLSNSIREEWELENN
ncbi:hypothetical protein [Thermaerobacillus caldiproteolyticus]|uniref:hypothetical protein n=1 Tax=Thermaerobacillus caldiproteolyticus TaxID=247480 RepID=UPI0018F152DF|nr:hypothetical protein [Anoxybacillus caldiproteolyticus]